MSDPGMKEGRCPKCGSQNVRHGPKGRASYGFYGNNAVTIGWKWLSVMLALLDTYVCVDCGYVERYVLEALKRREIEQRWPKAGS